MVMPSLLLEWPIARAQAFINTLLSHTNNVEALFAPLQQKRIRFVFEPMKIMVEMECKGGHVVLSTASPRPVALTLTGTPLQFLNSMASHTVSDLHISGDGKVAQALQRLLTSLSIDIESFLESFLGGTLAHALMNGMKRAHRASSELVKHTVNDFADYCHYEIKLSVSKGEIDVFSKDVNTLRYAVDHLSSKVAELKRRVEEYHV